ncbi:MAG: S-adenosylmethionine:tRNA ribosyltransferase-isomerase, partial [Clostridia bacterium]|nr:S-adenosylmethionine:tRNA ribosyltransferase-isomerase [Clostridia bacterium]
MAAVLTVLAYDNVPKFIENYKYSKAITEKTLSEYEHEIEHKLFKDILEYFDKGDTFVLNDTKVFPARLYG